jgi:hypothetical protein
MKAQPRPWPELDSAATTALKAAKKRWRMAVPTARKRVFPSENTGLRVAAWRTSIARISQSLVTPMNLQYMENMVFISAGRSKRHCPCHKLERDLDLRPDGLARQILLTVTTACVLHMASGK